MTSSNESAAEKVEALVKKLTGPAWFSRLLPQGSVRRHVLWQLYRAVLPKPQADARVETSTPDQSVDPDVQNTEHFLTVSRYAGFPLSLGAKILDFGCGAGAMVRLLLERGYDAFGYDIMNYLDERSRAMPERFLFLDEEEHELGNHVIDWGKFVLPYPDNSFDAIFTSQVFEHVMHHDPVFREFARVLKPEAASINLFPPRAYPFEQHIRVPFGHFIHSKTYYYVMALLGCRNMFQGEQKPSVIARENYRYVRDGLNYRPNSELLHLARRYFESARIDQSALLYGAKLSPFSLWYHSHFNKTICLVMAGKKFP